MQIIAGVLGLLFFISLIILIVGLIKPSAFRDPKTNEPLTRKQGGLYFGITTVVLLVLAGVTVPSTPSKPTAAKTTAPTPAPSHSATPKPTAAPKKSVSPTPTPKASTKATPTPAHTVVYTWGLDKGHMTSADLQQVGISWDDPTNGKNQIPADILGAVTQINKGVYSVTYHVASINDRNIHSGINNYNNPDATLSCTITVDGQLLTTAEVAPSGGGDCFGDPALRQ